LVKNFLKTYHKCSRKQAHVAQQAYQIKQHFNFVKTNLSQPNKKRFLQNTCEIISTSMHCWSFKSTPLLKDFIFLSKTKCSNRPMSTRQMDAVHSCPLPAESHLDLLQG